LRRTAKNRDLPKQVAVLFWFYDLSKNRFDHARRTAWGISPTGEVPRLCGVDKKAQGSSRGGGGAAGIDEHELDLHPLGQNALDVNGYALPDL